MKKILFLISFLLFANFTAAQTCPRGEVNDPYPGQCGQYIDENQNNLCDQSEVSQSAVLNFESTEKLPISAENKKPDLPERPRTEFVKIWVISWLSYLALELLAKKGKVSPMLAKKIFNAILLISFLVCAFSSLIYLIRADYGYNLAIPNLYQLHLQSGIWLIGISLAHLAWHWQYYWSYLRK